MLPKRDVMREKIVTSGGIRPENFKMPQLSDETKEVIRNSNIQSLKGLLGPDSEEVFRKLLKQYWGLT